MSEVDMAETEGLAGAAGGGVAAVVESEVTGAGPDVDEEVVSAPSIGCALVGYD